MVPKADMPRDRTARTANHPPTIVPGCRTLSKIDRISAEIHSEFGSQNRRERQGLRLSLLLPFYAPISLFFFSLVVTAEG